ncbi:MAG: caspase family protein [Syntrophales bacterium LBB04]|nr:caspase family protein [Syntrophales bacterium LBB04]
MRHIRTLYIFLIFILLSSTPFLQAATEQRTALVIGNGAYESGRLKNPTNDATDIAAALQKVGFTVILKKNASLKDMDDAIENFGNRLKRGGVGLFYFAGHGVQVNGINYLIPIGAKINRESDVKYGAVDVNKILDEMANANNGLNIVMLDACRDNPYARSFRNAARGLAIVSSAPTGTFISYSTGPGNVARDGEGRNSPYTSALIQYMKKPGLTIEDVFKEVRQKLRKETGQVPWELSSLEGKFFFVPGNAGKTTEVEKDEAVAPTTELDAEQLKIEAEREKLRKEKELLEQKEALAREKRELAEREKQLAIGARPSASTDELDVKIRNFEMAERELEEQRPRLDPKVVDTMQKKLKAERNRLEEEKKQLAMGQRQPVSKANEIKRDGRFIAYDNGTVLDTQTNLMWAAKDNGYHINWQGAKSYCENYRGGGYTDWRMPTQDELAGLYDAGKTYQSECRGLFMTQDIHLTELIRLTCYLAWASETSTRDPFAAIFSFKNGDRFMIHRGTIDIERALPVRSGKPDDERALPVRSGKTVDDQPSKK